MSNRRPTFSAANLLAQLEAASLGLVNVSEDDRSRASEAADEVRKVQCRKWRAHRRPSPGRSRRMRDWGVREQSVETVETRTAQDLEEERHGE